MRNPHIQSHFFFSSIGFSPYEWTVWSTTLNLKQAGYKWIHAWTRGERERIRLHLVTWRRDFWYSACVFNNTELCHALLSWEWIWKIIAKTSSNPKTRRHSWQTDFRGHMCVQKVLSSLLQILSIYHALFQSVITHISTPVKHFPNNFYSRGEVRLAVRYHRLEGTFNIRAFTQRCPTQVLT